MIRLAFFLTILVLSFSSCSDNEYTDPIVGEYYSGSLITYQDSAEIIIETFENVEVVELSGDRIEIKLGSSLGSMIGTVDEFSNISVELFQGVTDDGTELYLPNGGGNFSIEPVVGNPDFDEAKTIFLTFSGEVTPTTQLTLAELQ